MKRNDRASKLPRGPAAMAMVASVFVLAACSASPSAAPTTTSPGGAGLQVADAEVRQMLLDSCYPCHANERSDPWYAHLAPSSWSSAGRTALNFDEWQSYDPAKRNAAIAAIVTVVRDGYMPLKDYTFFNGAAKLNEAQRQQIIQWANSEAQPAH